MGPVWQPYRILDHFTQLLSLRQRRVADNPKEVGGKEG